MFLLKAVPVVILAFLAAAPYVNAAPGDLIKTLQPPTGTAVLFGVRVTATSQDLLVGGRDNTEETSYSGMLAAYDRNFVHKRTICAPEPVTNDCFGQQIVVSGQSVYAGERDRTVSGFSGAGAVYKFSLRTWAPLLTFNNPNPKKGSRFSADTAANNKYLAIGAHDESTVAHATGAVYVYDARSGSLLRTLHSPLTLLAQWFGESLAFAGNRLLVGADGSTSAGEAAGAIYAYDTRSWQLVQSIQSPEPETDAYFGNPIVVASRYIVTAACMQDDGAANSGTVYVLDAKTYALVRAIRNPNPSKDSTFGRAIAVKGNLALVGAPGDSTDGKANGIAYVFDLNTGALLLTLRNPLPVEAGSGNFGCSVQFMGNKLVLGAYGNPLVDPYSRGHVFVFEGMRK